MKKTPRETPVAYHVRNEESSGPPVVFVHGAGGNKSIWLSLTRVLADFLPDRPLFMVDLPGHGDSAGTGRGLLGDYARDLIVFLEELDLSPADLVGHSMGGAVALTLALDRPDVVRRLAVIGCGYRLPTSPALIQAMEQDFRGAVGLVRDFGFGADVDPKVIDPVIEDLLACPPETVVGDFKACSVYDVQETVPGLAPPLAVFCGTKDRLTSEPRNRALAQAVPEAGFFSYEDAGHMLMVERPEEVGADLAAFLSE